MVLVLNGILLLGAEKLAPGRGEDARLQTPGLRRSGEARRGGPVSEAPAQGGQARLRGKLDPAALGAQPDDAQPVPGPTDGLAALARPTNGQRTLAKFANDGKAVAELKDDGKAGAGPARRMAKAGPANDQGAPAEPTHDAKTFAELRSSPESDARIARLSWANALKVGVLQSIALIPGFSRTGSTMTGALLVGLSHEDAARFSFLLATPVIGGPPCSSFRS